MPVWIGGKESFYCHLDECTFTREPTTNSTDYQCQKAKCECLPGRFLCGEDGSIGNIVNSCIDLDEFFHEEIKGPGKFHCDEGESNKLNCRFEEPGMNALLAQIFGDEYISLNCARDRKSVV